MRIRDKYKYIGEIAEELNLPIDLVERVCVHQWAFMKKKIRELPLDRDLTEEEFGKLKVSFNLPQLGKLYTTYKFYKAGRKRLEIIKKKKDEDSTKESNPQI